MLVTYMCVFMCVIVQATINRDVWKSEDSFQESVLSFYHEVLGIRFSSRYSYPLGHPISPALAVHLLKRQ